MTQAEFAATLGVTEKTVFERETGRSPVNLQAALAIEFVVASRSSRSLRAVLEAHLATVEAAKLSPAAPC